MIKQAKTAADSIGNKIIIGDLVEWLNFYDKNKPTGVITKVLEIHRQGYDGTILRCDKGAEWNKSFKTIAAKFTIKRDNPDRLPWEH